jgi:hypothetical protein
MKLLHRGPAIPTKILKVESLELGETITVLNLASLDKMVDLQSPEEPIIETNQDYFLLQRNVAFKVLKKDALPEILKASDLCIQSGPYQGHGLARG